MGDGGPRAKRLVEEIGELRLNDIGNTQQILQNRQGETYDRNVDLPTPASPRSKIGISGTSIWSVVVV